jgi:hypothetical protein
MDIFMQALTNSLSDDMLGTLTQSLGADQATTEKAIGLALPLLLGSLERNAGSADGAQALSKALTRDHDGSILDDLVANLGRMSRLMGRLSWATCWGGSKLAPPTPSARRRA